MSRAVYHLEESSKEREREKKRLFSGRLARSLPLSVSYFFVCLCTSALWVEVTSTTLVAASRRCLSVNLSPWWNHTSFNKLEQIIRAIFQHIKGRVSRPVEESGLQCCD